jgi:glucosylceramidase
MCHFSKYIRPGAKIIGTESSDKELMLTAALNPDKSISVVIFNEGKTAKIFTLSLNEITTKINISGQAIQTVVIPNKHEPI